MVLTDETRVTLETLRLLMAHQVLCVVASVSNLFTWVNPCTVSPHVQQMGVTLAMSSLSACWQCNIHMCIEKPSNSNIFCVSFTQPFSAAIITFIFYIHVFGWLSIDICSIIHMDTFPWPWRSCSLMSRILCQVVVIVLISICQVVEVTQHYTLKIGVNTLRQKE